MEKIYLKLYELSVKLNYLSFEKGNNGWFEQELCKCQQDIRTMLDPSTDSKTFSRKLAHLSDFIHHKVIIKQDKSGHMPCSTYLREIMELFAQLRGKEYDDKVAEIERLREENKHLRDLLYGVKPSAPPLK